MAEMISVREAAVLWNITERRVETGAFRKRERAPKLPLPIGVSNYCLASLEYYYIDKTMMIKDFIDERPMVTLFTRPPPLW